MKNQTNYFLLIMLLIGILSMAFLKMNAQNPSFCSTIGGGPGAVGKIPSSVGDNQNSTTTSGPYFIRVYVHVVRKPDGTGGLSKQEIDQSFHRLNADFNPHNIFFVRDCEVIDVLVSEDDYDNFSIYCNLWDNPLYQHDDGIDIFIGSDVTINGNGGRAKNIPSDVFWVAGAWNSAGPFSPLIPISTSSVISHEMGHYLGLWHTQHGTVTESGIDCEGNPLEFPSQCCELVNGSNSNDCGDYVIDTDADPGAWATWGVPDPCVNLNMYYSTDEVYCSEYFSPNVTADVNEDIYTPPTDNIMSNGQLRCINGFTVGQGVRMRQMISFSPVLQACLVQPDYYSQTINSSTTWTTSNTPNNGNFLIEDELIIEGGATLTIGSNVTVRFGEEGRIVIKPNGNLFLDGTLTGKGCGITWRGIEVWGNSASSQYTFGGTRAQGRFVGRSGSVVENAETAVQLYGPSYTNHAGGQISCSGTTFRNNIIAVEFAPYRNFWPFATSQQGQPRSYFGNFTSCSFETNDDYSHNLGFNSFLHLTGVNGVRITGSHFTNTQSITNCSSVADYGYGIFATDAGFRVEAKCTSSTYPCNNYVHSTFTGLGYGIHTSTAVNNRPFTIHQTDFSNCYFGVKSNAVSNGTLLN